MAIDCNKPVYFFDQDSGYWYKYNEVNEQFELHDRIPKLTQNFAGIGTRNLTLVGKCAIKEVYNNTFPRSETT
jgi:hypothetical protein